MGSNYDNTENCYALKKFFFSDENHCEDGFWKLIIHRMMTSLEYNGGSIGTNWCTFLSMLHPTHNHPSRVENYILPLINPLRVLLDCCCNLHFIYFYLHVTMYINSEMPPYCTKAFLACFAHLFLAAAPLSTTVLILLCTLLYIVYCCIFNFSSSPTMGCYLVSYMHPFSQ